MTASNKVDLLVKNDGTVEPLLRGSQPRSKRSSKKPLKILLILGILFLVLSAVSFAGLAMLRREFHTEYRLRYSYNNFWKCGTVTFDETEAIETFSNEDVTAITAGFAGFSAAKIRTARNGGFNTVCLVRHDEQYNLAGPPIFPRHEVLDKYMKEIASQDSVEVIIEQNVWVPDVFAAVDFEELPNVIQALCRDVPTYKMRPAYTRDDDKEYDEDDDVYDDEVMEDEEEEEEEDGETTDDYPFKNYKDEDESSYYKEPVLTKVPKIQDTQKAFADELYGETAEIDDDINGQDPENLTENDYYDDYLPGNSNSDEDESTTAVPTAYSSLKQNMMARKKRQIFPDINEVAQLNDDIEEETEEAAEKEEDEEQRERESHRVVKLPSLKKPKLDASRQCCSDCSKARLLCNVVCVPVQQLAYPQFFKSCDYRQCTVVLPCESWRAKSPVNI